MVGCISPSALCYEETVNTLKYASRARWIKKKVVQNVKEVDTHVSKYKEVIESLKSEVDFLKEQLQRALSTPPVKTEIGARSLSCSPKPESDSTTFHVPSKSDITNERISELQKASALKDPFNDVDLEL